jgi:hypothetical protein
VTPSLRLPRPMTLALVAANLAAAAFAVRPLLPQSTPMAALATAAQGDAEPAPFRLAPFAAYAGTVNRPLFAPSRRPPQAAAASVLGNDAGRYRLVGLVIAGAARHALIADKTTGRSVALGEGQAVAGWVVKRIEADAVILASPAGEVTLRLTPQAGAK